MPTRLMFKMGCIVAGEWAEHSHPPVFSIQSSGTKLVSTAPGGDPLIFERLAACLAPPCFLLYILHTPRGEGEPGRYQSGELSRTEVADFLEQFSQFLKQDSRFDLWLHSPEDAATVVWDRHNLIHAYGPVETFAGVLRSLGFEKGEPEVPAPHEHHYHRALDVDAGAILASLDWNRTPLQPEDEQ